MSVIRESFSNLLRAAVILGFEDDKFIESVRKAVPRLYPFHIGQMGQLQEWYQDWDRPEDTHRHISHLYSLYPGSQISPEFTPDLTKASVQTLIHRGDVSTGWSMAWKVNWWARLKEGNRALEILKGGIQPKNDNSREATYGNLFSTAHGHFQIDGTLGAPAGIAELLLQSHAGYIHLLPALPDEWESGSISGLVARGGFVVDMVWNNGKLQSLTIHSKIGGNCRISGIHDLISEETQLAIARGFNPNPLLQQPDLVPWISNAENERVEIKSVAGTKYDFSTEAGKTYYFKRK